MLSADDLIRDLKSRADPDKSQILSRFFKTGPGEYGEGDRFLGLTVPTVRNITKKYRDLPLPEIDRVVTSPYHEIRLAALLVLVNQFQKADPKTGKVIFDYYLSHTKWINNWDLVDLSAPRIVGGYLWDKDRSVLFTLVKSTNLWERRIAVLATACFINQGDTEDTLKIAEILLTDKHDLIHKATGWMLREVGKRCSQEILEDFLNQHLPQMPRTMLRYAIEKFDTKKRSFYLNKKTP